MPFRPGTHHQLVAFDPIGRHVGQMIGPHVGQMIIAIRENSCVSTVSNALSLCTVVLLEGTPLYENCLLNALQLLLE